MLSHNEDDIDFRSPSQKLRVSDEVDYPEQKIEEGEELRNNYIMVVDLEKQSKIQLIENEIKVEYSPSNKEQLIETKIEVIEEYIDVFEVRQEIPRKETILESKRKPIAREVEHDELMELMHLEDLRVFTILNEEKRKLLGENSPNILKVNKPALGEGSPNISKVNKPALEMISPP